MKKIIFSFVSIISVVAIVSGTAYSLFFSTPNISGITFSTGSVELLIGDTSSFGTSYSPGNYLFENMLPGDIITKTFSLKNNSFSNVSMDISAKMGVGQTETSADSWTLLKDKIQIRFSNDVGTTLSTWKTLSQIQTTAVDFDSGLAKNAVRSYKFEVQLDPTSDETVSGEGLSGVSFIFTGTQE